MNSVSKFFDYDALNGEFSRLSFACKSNKKVSVIGMGQAERVSFCFSQKRPILYLTSDYVTATKVYNQFKDALKENCFLAPVTIDNLFYKRAQSVEPFKEKFKILNALLKNEAKVIVASADFLLSKFPNKESFKKSVTLLKKKNEYNLEALKKYLAILGYEKTELVSSAGQFASRGDIFDIFPFGEDNAYRLEFWGDEIDSIKKLDLQTLTVGEPCDSIEILPATELLMPPQELNKTIKILEEKKKFAENNKVQQVYINSLTEIISRLETGERNFALSFILSLFDDGLSSIFDYLSKDTLICIDEGKMCYDMLANSSKEIETRFGEFKKRGEALCENSANFSASFVFEKIKEFPCIVHQKLTSNNRFFSPEEVFNFKSIPVSRYFHNFGELVEDLTNFKTNGFDVFLLAGSSDKASALSARLAESEVFIDAKNSASLSDSGSFILPYYFSGGFVLPECKKVVISSTDLFAPKRASAKITATRKDVFSIPKVGDYVVHNFHGIGVCEGITNLKNNFGSKDYVVVRYAGGDILYVPIDGLDQLERFSGAEAPKKLSKIGGADFAKVKEKVRAKVKELAFDLTELYAKREAKKGFAFSRDNAMQREFEDAFPYVETEDQLKSVEEIKRDMEKSKVMDRLLCGDVGFGKTEVAMRAMMKAVLDGKQVAFMAPTTILSEQHYNNCKKRFAEFGVSVEVLNRFKSSAQVSKILNDLSKGRIDILCGTHRLLSEDVKFADLGLVVLDEEQKFGVGDKEKLKTKYPLVDFLTLSATPIPRTLHMSLSGIRDISIIGTAPSARVPVQTSVCEYSESLIKDACEREIARGGQVFILYNSVDKIYGFASNIQKLLPNAKIVVAHGQMQPKQLEEIILDFYHKESDVLVCTTIIENGIDIENANTLIVCESDKFGLSQLYQIRGRVGRGSRTAYAYFTYDYDKMLSEEAYKRLDAISEFTEFGSGFKIAMRDLEIRGSGNVLGAEQHGFMQKVGYELYSKLLAEAVAEIRGEKTEEIVETVMRISLDAFIPESYISVSANRMTAYKNIASIKSLDDKRNICEDFKETFGPVPIETKNLINIAYAKSLAQKLGAIEVISTKQNIKIIFDKPEKITSSENIGEAVFKYRNQCALELGSSPMIKLASTSSDEQNFALLLDFLEASNLKK